MTYKTKLGRELASTVTDVDSLHERRLAAELRLACDEIDRLNKECDELQAETKKVIDIAIDEAGMPTRTMLGKDAPSRAMRALLAERNRLRAAEQAKVLHELACADQIRAEQAYSLMGMDPAAPGGDMSIITDYEIRPDGAMVVTDRVTIPGVGPVTATTITPVAAETSTAMQTVGTEDTKPAHAAQRGVDFPCEGCGKLEGSARDNRGFYRCHGCGYPGQ